MKKQSLIEDELEFFKFLEENNDILIEAAKENSTELKNNKWVPNKEWFSE